MAEFDPYHKWLGIAAKDQPPHHYRLLGIDLFESDLDVIEVAANKQMTFLQTCATGPKLALSQRLLNEMAAARLCLLSVKDKAAYDAKLRAQLGETARRSPVFRSGADDPTETIEKPPAAEDQFDFNAEEPFEIHDLIRNAATMLTFRTIPTVSFASVWVISVLLACGVAVLLVRFSQSDEASTPNDPAKPNSAASGNRQEKVQKSKDVTRSPEQITNSIGMKLTFIPAGEFLMGTSEQSTVRFSDESPQHFVKITKPFYLGTYEVTQREYAALFSGLNPSTIRSEALPVTNVDWVDALSFCRKLSEKEQQAYRLPTEAEWEYACWAGINDWLQQNQLSDFSWYFGNANQYPHPVGTRQANPFGLYDMFGNVAEWCQDWYGYDYYARSPTMNPSGPMTGSSRCVRGGDWDTSADKCRRAYRGAQSESVRNSRTGFRLVLEIEADGTPKKYVSPSIPVSGSEKPATTTTTLPPPTKSTYPSVSPPPTPIRPSYVHPDAVFWLGHWYWFSRSKASFADAQKQAASMQGRLVVVSTQPENVFVGSKINGPTWLGILRQKGKWEFPAGRRASFFNWDATQPSGWYDENFAAIHPGGKWHDYRADSLLYCVEWGDE